MRTSSQFSLLSAFSIDLITAMTTASISTGSLFSSFRIGGAGAWTCTLKFSRDITISAGDCLMKDDMMESGEKEMDSLAEDKSTSFEYADLMKRVIMEESI
jgi:hypothetical protein